MNPNVCVYAYIQKRERSIPAYMSSFHLQHTALFGHQTGIKAEVPATEGTNKQKKVKIHWDR